MFFNRTFLLTCIIGLGACLRFYQISSAPSAINYDEALNGLTAIQILDGKYPELLSFDDGREPLHFYLASLSISIFGNTPGALRLPFVTCSLLLVFIVYLISKELYGVKVGMIASLLCACTVWTMYLGRYATRSVLFGLVAGIAFYCALCAWRINKTSIWLLSGFWIGVSYYTYPINLFVIPTIVFVFFGTYLWSRDKFLSNRRGILLMVLLMLLISSPMFISRIQLVEQSFGRPRSLSVFYEGQTYYEMLRTLFTQLALVGRMFFIRGDYNPLHNIPGRPVFDLFMIVPFVFGIARLFNKNDKMRGLLVVFWIMIFLLPTLLSKNAPHFLRSVGILPIIFVVPALGCVAIIDLLKHYFGKLLSIMIASGLLLGSLTISIRDFLFDDFLNEPYVYRAYHGDETLLALEINNRLIIGWIGNNLWALPNQEHTQVWVDPDVWHRSRYAEFLVGAEPNLINGLTLLSKASIFPSTGGAIFVHPRNYDVWVKHISQDKDIYIDTGPWLYDSFSNTSESLYRIISW
ncbi:MAG TPA: hypothetical protein DGM69_05870 [Chloroflexi bacterium]|nr:hypothetical protein [Chloroflexota bacterium]|tara:strand:+ start:661 stop:2223 length:1563 start_codon:yes stop_codon:yes gene_type:complete